MSATDLNKNDGPVREHRTVEESGGLIPATRGYDMTITPTADAVDPTCAMRDVDPGHRCSNSAATLQPGESCWATSSPTQIVVRGWNRPGDEGYDPRSAYVETFWLPIIGPTAVWMLRRFAHLLDTRVTVTIEADELAKQLGVGGGASHHTPVARTLRRLIAFQLARQLADGSYEVRTTVPRLHVGQIVRLSAALQHAHARWDHTEAVGF